MAKSFILNRLPVPLSSEQEKRSSVGASGTKIFPYSHVKLICPSIARVVIESGMVVLYHCMDNPRESDDSFQFSPLEFELDDGPAIEALMQSFQEGIIVSDLPHPSEELEDKVGVAESLFKEGLLMIMDEATLPFDSSDVSGDDNDDDPF